MVSENGAAVWSISAKVDTGTSGFKSREIA